MISCLKIKNFKSIDSVEIGCGSLNLFAGSNGSGKSSILQAMLLIMQCKENGQGTIVNLNGEYLSLGTASKILYQWADDNKVLINVSFKNGNNIDLDFDIAETSEDDVLSVDINYRRCAEVANVMRYLSANRITPLSFYQYSSNKIESNKTIGIGGEYSVAYLARFGKNTLPILALKHKDSGKFGIGDSLEANVNAWMQKISPGVIIDAQRMTEINSALLRYGYVSGGKISGILPANAGFGITYTLPVIVTILSANPGDIVIIENPEAHLHPAGQTEIGLLLATAANAGVQIFIETHSDHIFNAIRIAIKEKIINDINDVNLYYVDRESASSGYHTKVSQVKVSDAGRIITAPTGFLDEWQNALYTLL